MDFPPHFVAPAPFEFGWHDGVATQFDAQPSQARV